jgi:hypothetical protein
MKLKDLLAVLLCAFLTVGLMSCDVFGEEEETSSASKYKNQISWDTQLTGDYAAGASLVDADDAVVSAAVGSMQLGQVTSVIATDSYFGSGNGLQYIHDGVDSWGGVFTHVNPTDLSALTEAKIAIKGTISADLTCMGLKLEGGNASAQEINFLSYKAKTDGDWTIYTIPLTDYDLVEFDAFMGAGVWNPKSGTDLTFEGGYQATDFVIDVAFN